jgi:hypothetical protein
MSSGAVMRPAAAPLLRGFDSTCLQIRARFLLVEAHACPSVIGKFSRHDMRVFMASRFPARVIVAILRVSNNAKHASPR